MYHSRFKGDHYKAGFKYGSILSRNCIDPLSKIIISEERRGFAQKCFPIYKEFFPEIIEEIKGMSDGLNANNIKSNYKEICSFLFTMYAFTFENKCSSFAFKTDDDVILAKNSDFLIDIEKYCDSTYYRLDNSYSFVGNTTAFIEMEDGNRLILTTEKDAARLKHHPDLPEDLKQFIYVLPIEVEILQDQEHLFNQNIVNYVRAHSRNSVLPKK